MAKPLNMPFRFPVKGLDEYAAYFASDPVTTRDCLNVLPFDAGGERIRGGKRPGTARVIAEQVDQSDTPIQRMKQITLASGTPIAGFDWEDPAFDVGSGSDGEGVGGGWLRYAPGYVETDWPEPDPEMPADPPPDDGAYEVDPPVEGEDYGDLNPATAIYSEDFAGYGDGAVNSTANPPWEARDGSGDTTSNVVVDSSTVEATGFIGEGLSSGSGYAVDYQADMSGLDFTSPFFVQAEVDLSGIDGWPTPAGNGEGYDTSAGIGWRCIQGHDGGPFSDPDPHGGLFCTLYRSTGRNAGGDPIDLQRLILSTVNGSFWETSAGSAGGGSGLTTVTENITVGSGGTLKVADTTDVGNGTIKIEIYLNSTLLLTRWYDGPALGELPGLGRFANIDDTSESLPSPASVTNLIIADDEGAL